MAIGQCQGAYCCRDDEREHVNAVEGLIIDR
jgi:hypothetical protein